MASTWAAIMIIMICKMYLLYYDYEYERILASEKWAIFIDPSIIKNNWFLINKNKYGSPIWLIKWLIVPIIAIWIVIDVTILLINRTLYFIIISIWFLPHLILGIWFWRKYPSFNDNLGIRKEIKYTLILASIFIIVLIVQLILLIIVDANASVGLFISPQVACIIHSWITVIYPQRANEHRAKMLKEPCTTGRGIEWREVISSMEGYEQFALFLEREFSIENILFITEYVQLKHEILKVERYGMMMETELGLDYDLSLPADIPKSLIVQEFMVMMDVMVVL